MNNIYCSPKLAIARRSINSGVALPPYSITINSRTSAVRRSIASTHSAPLSTMRKNRTRSSTRSATSNRSTKRKKSRTRTQPLQSPVTKLLNNQYGDASSVDSFGTYGGGPHSNPLYSGSRYSLYSTNSQRNQVCNNPNQGSNAPSLPRNHRPLSYHEYLQQQRQSQPSLYEPTHHQSHHSLYHQNQQNFYNHQQSNRPRSPIYMNSETAI